MFKDWRRHRAQKKVKAGDGRALKRFRWWQPFSRVLFYLNLQDDDGALRRYAVDVSYWDYLVGEAKAHLYLEGSHHAESALPAVFEVPGGRIQVAMGVMGLKRCHYSGDDGASRQLTPDSDSAEGYRARLDQNRPLLSRWIGISSLLVLLVVFVLGIPQLLEMVTHWDFVAQYTGTFTSPIQLPDWLNAGLIFAAIAASTERALRLRYNWLLDGGDFDLDF